MIDLFRINQVVFQGMQYAFIGTNDGCLFIIDAVIDIQDQFSDKGQLSGRSVVFEWTESETELGVGSLDKCC